MEVFVFIDIHQFLRERVGEVLPLCFESFVQQREPECDNGSSKLVRVSKLDAVTEPLSSSCSSWVVFLLDGSSARVSLIVLKLFRAACVCSFWQKFQMESQIS